MGPKMETWGELALWGGRRGSGERAWVNGVRTEVHRLQCAQ